MGTGFNLNNLYMNQMQYGNSSAYNPMMFSNATAAMSGNYSLTVPQFNFASNNFAMPAFGSITGYGYQGYSSGSSSSSSSADSYEQKALKEAEARKKRIQENTQKAEQKLEESKQSVLFKGYGLTKEQEKVLLEQHAKTFEPDMKLLGTLGTGIGIGSIMKNGGLVSHGWNTAKSLGPNSATSMMFKGNETLWKNSSNLMQEAYYQMHKAERRHHKGLGMIKHSYSDQTYKKMEDMMYNAIKGGNADEIAEVTERFKQINKNDGWLSNAIKRLKGKAVESPDDILKNIQSGTVSQDVADDIAKGAKALVNSAHMTWGKAFKQAAGGPIGIVMGLFGLIPEIGNIKKAFSLDRKKGWKQVGQSVVKFGANWGGYIAGETVGIMAGAKIGAMIGSVVPGLGTAIGAVAGMLCGTIVSHFAGKGAKKLMGDNVANEVKTQEVAQKEGGADEIIQTLLAQAQNGELKDEEALRIINDIKQRQAALQQSQQGQQQLAVA